MLYRLEFCLCGINSLWLVSEVGQAKHALTLLDKTYSCWLVYGQGDLRFWAEFAALAGVNDVRSIELRNGYMLASIAKALVEWAPADQELVIYDNLWLANICRAISSGPVSAIAGTSSLVTKPLFTDSLVCEYSSKVIDCPGIDIWSDGCQFVSC